MSSSFIARQVPPAFFLWTEGAFGPSRVAEFVTRMIKPLAALPNNSNQTPHLKGTAESPVLFPASLPDQDSLIAQQPGSAWIAAAGCLLIAALIFAPWAFGSRPPIPSAILAGLTALSFLSWGYGLWSENRLPKVPVVCGICLVLLLGMMCVSLANPQSTYDPISDRFVPAPRYRPYLPSTVDVANSLPAVLCLSGLLLALPVAADLSAQEIWRRSFLITIGWNGFAVVVAALILKAGAFPALERSLEQRTWAQGEVFGPLDYHGSAATLINLTLPALGFFAAESATAARRIFLIAVLGVMVTGALVDTSRTGLVLTLLMTTALARMITHAWKRQPLANAEARLQRRAVIAVLVICAISMVTTVRNGGSRALDRLQSIKHELTWPWYPRYQQNHAAWEISQQHPWFGTGLGSYKLLVPHSRLRGQYFAAPYRPGQSYTVLNHHVQNDYLQTLLEWGWTGLLVWATLLGTASLGLICNFRRTASPSAFATVAAVALTGIFLHAVVDSPFQVPAIQLCAIVFIGLAFSQLNERPLLTATPSTHGL